MFGVHWTVANFFIFLLYLAASIQSWRTSNDTATRSNRENSIWIIAAGLFCALAANTAFGGLDQLANGFRSGVQTGDWYGDRMVFQLSLTIAVLVFAAVVISLTLVRLRAMPMSTRLTFAGLLALIAFLIVRAISLHVVDQMLFARISGVTFSTSIEGVSVVLILVVISWRRADLR